MLPPLSSLILGLLAPDAPKPTLVNWKSLQAAGWRWVINLPAYNVQGAIQAIKTYQEQHGKENVTIGQPLDPRLYQPTSLDGKSLIGVYLRDVEKLVDEMTHALDDEDAIAKWLKD